MTVKSSSQRATGKGIFFESHRENTGTELLNREKYEKSAGTGCDRAAHMKPGELTMDKRTITKHRKLYERMLFDDVIPFWMKHSPDRKHGGYLHMLDRSGVPYSTDKFAWPHGREVWMFSLMCDVVEHRDEWLEMARLGWEFMMKHFFDNHGRIYYSVAQAGKPLTIPRRIFSETFLIMAAVRYARAARDDDAANIARELFRRVVALAETPAAGSQKAIPGARNMVTMAMPMIMLNITREMMALDGETPELMDYSNACLDRLLDLHLHPERKLAFENVAPDGSLMTDLPEGRFLIPGHAIEAAWFIMQEGMARGDRFLIDRACELTLWELEFGWDSEYGGITYFMDSEGKPPLALESDQKLWWCHNEALIALIHALHLRGGNAYETWYERVHDYTFRTFPDAEYGEWIGYYHRDGRQPALTVKGSNWKCCFHLPRHLLFGWQLLSKMERGE